MGFLRKVFCCIFCWKVKNSNEEMKESEVVLALSFGLRDNTSGTSNLQLATIVKEICHRYAIPVIAQWEISDTCILADVIKAGVVRGHRTKGKYLDTLEVLMQSIEICKRRGWKKAIIVAHPDHLWRCVAIAKKLGFKAVVADTSFVEYDAKSIQPWTRSRMRFVPREIASRFLFLFKGWI